MYIAFLRGINVSGKNKISMESLKTMMLDLGCREVKTYLNTGNIVFDKVLGEETIEMKIKNTFDLDISVIVVEHDVLKEVIASYTLSDGSINAYITLFKSSVSALEDIIDPVKKDDDEYLFFDKHLCLYVPSGYGRTKITNNYLERKTKVKATTRNMKTLMKVCELSVS